MIAYANPTFDSTRALATNKRDMDANLGDGYALIRFDKERRTITFECWPRYADLSKGDTAQYPGWPISFRMEENDGRKVTGHLPEIVSDIANPVVQVINETDGEILYTLRIRGNRFRPHVYGPGSYTVRAGRDTPDPWSASGLKPDAKDAKALRVTLK